MVAVSLLAPPRGRAQTAGLGPTAPGRAHGSSAVSAATASSDLARARVNIRNNFMVGRVEEAMAETEKAVRLVQAARGRAHPEVGYFKVVLAHFHESRGEFAAARDLFRDAAEIFDRDTMRTGELALQAQASLAQVEQLAAQDEPTRRRLMDWIGATALVFTRDPIGSAFCVDCRGLFVTTADLVADLAPSITTEFVRDESRIVGTRVRPTEGEVPLALRMRTLGGLGPRLPARVLRVDRSHNFALLAVKPDQPLPRLEFASDPPGRGSTVTALTEAVISVDDSDSRLARHPMPLRFTVPRAAKVETVRVRRGKCWLITLADSPPAGPSGWPVLDGQGRVVGVLFNGLPGTEVHYVLPSAVLAEFLGLAQVVIDPPVVPFRNRRSPLSWEVPVWSGQPLPAGATLEIVVGEGPAQRRFEAERLRDDAFTARVIPISPDTTDTVDLVASDAIRPTRWKVPDSEISVGETRLRLSALRLLRPGQSPAAYDAAGRALFGSVSGLEAVQSLRPESEAEPRPSKGGALRIEFPAEDPPPIACEAVLRQSERVLDRVTFSLQFREPPADVLGSLDALELTPKGVGRFTNLSPAGKDITRIPQARLAPDVGPANADAVGIVRALACTPDNRMILVGGNDMLVHIWDPATHRELRKLSGHQRAVLDLAVTADGQRALSASADGTIRVWDLGSGKELKVYRGHPAGARCVAASPDGRLASSGGDGKDRPLRVWEIETGRDIVTFSGHEAHIFAVTFLPDGRRILSAGDDSRVRLWDLVTGRQIRSFDGHKGNVYALALSSDGAVAVSGGEDLSLRFWDVESGRLLRSELRCHSEPINRVALLKDGPTVLSVGDDGIFSVLNLSQNRRINHMWKNTRLTALSALPDGRTAALGATGQHVTLADLHENGVMTPLSGFREFPTGQGTDAARTDRARPAGTSDDRPGCLKLPGALTDLALGRGGRYVLLAMGRRKELAIFDVNTADVVKTVPLAGEDVLVAAGAAKAVLVYPSLGFLHRIDLETLAVDAHASIPVAGRVRAIAMGSDSAGPILAAWSPAHRRDPNTNHNFSLISLDTLKVLDVSSINKSQDKLKTVVTDGWQGHAPIRGVLVPFDLNGRKSLHLRASPGGTLFGLWDTNNSPEGFATFELKDNEVRVNYEHDGTVHVVPGPDGRTIYTGAMGRVDPSGNPKSRLGQWVKFPRMIPSTDPALYIGVSLPTLDPKGPKVVVTFHDAETDRVRGHLVEPLDDFAPESVPSTDSATPGRQMLDFDRRFLWLPAAQLLVMIPPTDDRLILRRVDIERLSSAAPNDTEVKP
jgi:WD40 repeat protein